MEIHSSRMLSFITLAILVTITSSANDWKPIFTTSAIQDRKFVEERYILPGSLGQYESSHFGPNLLSLGYNPKDHCSIRKVSFDQEDYFQYMEYTHKMPDMKEFTMCMWIKFDNHSTDHPLFSYSVGDEPKEILSWVSNTERASFISLAVAGRTFYRLNYPFKLMSWYHSCQSWNGKTGEWQIWVNSERIGRGFYNRLVGHVIKGGGFAITGQNHATLNGETDDNSHHHQMHGMMGEMTMLQLYRVALTAGKAHKDHKHHHVNLVDHNGSPLSTPLNMQGVVGPLGVVPAIVNQIIRGAQLPYQVPINMAFPGLVKAQSNEGVKYNKEFSNGQFSPSTVTEQLINAYVKSIRDRNPVQQKSEIIFPNDDLSSLNPYFATELSNGNVQFIDPQSNEHLLFKRGEKESDVGQARSKRDQKDTELEVEKATDGTESTKKNTKRGLLYLSDGSYVDESQLNFDTVSFEQSLLSGLAGLGQNVPVQNIQKEQSDEREPAEAEVKAVMGICNECSDEPFEKALVLSWRHTSFKLHRGAKLLQSSPICKNY